MALYGTNVLQFRILEISQIPIEMISIDKFVDI